MAGLRGVAPDAVRADPQVGLVLVAGHDDLGAAAVDQLEVVAELQDAHGHARAASGRDRRDPAVEVAAGRAAADVRRRRAGDRQASPATPSRTTSSRAAARLTPPPPPRRRSAAMSREVLPASKATWASSSVPYSSSNDECSRPSSSASGHAGGQLRLVDRVLVAGQPDEPGGQVGVEPAEVLAEHRGGVVRRVGGHEDDLQLLDQRRVEPAQGDRDVGHRRRADVGAVRVAEEQQRRPARRSRP